MQKLICKLPEHFANCDLRMANSNPGLSAEEKDTFYERVFSKFASVPEEEMLVLGGDFNGYIGEHS